MKFSRSNSLKLVFLLGQAPCPSLASDREYPWPPNVSVNIKALSVNTLKTLRTLCLFVPVSALAVKELTSCHFGIK